MVFANSSKVQVGFFSGLAPVVWLVPGQPQLRVLACAHRRPALLAFPTRSALPAIRALPALLALHTLHSFDKISAGV